MHQSRESGHETVTSPRAACSGVCGGRGLSSSRGLDQSIDCGRLQGYSEGTEKGAFRHQIGKPLEIPKSMRESRRRGPSRWHVSNVGSGVPAQCVGDCGHRCPWAPGHTGPGETAAAAEPAEKVEAWGTLSAQTVTRGAATQPCKGVADQCDKAVMGTGGPENVRSPVFPAKAHAGRWGESLSLRSRGHQRPPLRRSRWRQGSQAAGELRRDGSEGVGSGQNLARQELPRREHRVAGEGSGHGRDEFRMEEMRAGVSAGGAGLGEQSGAPSRLRSQGGRAVG